MLATFFPPAAGIAPTRVASFVRHLPAYGWEPAVVTVDWHSANRKWVDLSAIDKSVEDRVLYRTPQPDLRRIPGRHVPPILSWQSLKLDPIAVVEHLGDRFYFGEPPIGSRFYVRAAIRFLKRHLEAHSYDAILATSPDLNPMVIAKSMSERFTIPWVADCRDDYAVFREGKPRYVQVERKLLQTASEIVTVSHGLAESIGARVGRDVEVIENGFEPEEVPVAPVGFFEPGVFNIVYTGSVSTYYPDRHDPAKFFVAVDHFLRRNPDANGRLAAHFFGDAALEPIIDHFEEKHPAVQGVIRDHGRVDRAVALQAQRAADVLLILAHPGRKGILTGKVFEYFGAQRPILAIPGDGDELDGLLARTATGTVLGTAEEGAEFLKESFRSWERGGKLPYACHRSEVARYHRSALAERLAGILDRAGSGRTAGN